MALGAVGLVTVAASSASATTITETFAAASATGPLELQQPETIDQPSSVFQGGTMTITVPSSSQPVPTTQSGVGVNYISGLQTIIPVPANSTFVPGSIVAGQWSFAPSGGGSPTTGQLTVTECTGPVAGKCTATANGTVYTGTPAGTTFTFQGNTPTPYIEATTGTAQFAAGGTLTLPAWSFNVLVGDNATGTIDTTVSEFDTNANVTVFGAPLTASVVAYPAAVVDGCITPTTPSTCTTMPAYQDQVIASTTIVYTPPQAPVLVPQTGNVSAGQCTTINVLNGATEIKDTPDPASIVVTTLPGHGNIKSIDPATGNVQYCNTGGTGPTDSFQVTAAGTANPSLVSDPVTETVNISYNQCSAGDNSGLSQCSLHQAIILPVTPGQIILSQSNGLPLDFLGGSLCAGGMTPGITLSGNEQAACGVVSPLTVTNATGLDTGWTLTGQVSDFNDPAAPGIQCDTPASYSNHCIPGDNLAWEPAAAVAHSIVPGDTAQVTAGDPVPPFSPELPAASTDPLLAGILQNAVQANPVVEPSPNAGLDASPQTMCSTASGHSGGTFVCGAGLELVIPASAAEPAAGAYGMPAYQATLTITLS